MVKIDGGRVKSLREVKGLTQLYLASAVEVTTDTISRWENKRYPQIKKENAIRLAEALEVSLEEIIEQHADQGGQAETEVEAAAAEATREVTPEASRESAPLLEERPAAPARISLVAGLLALVVVLGLFAWHRFSPGNLEIAAVRMAPAHMVPGQPFPVVVKIDTGTEASSFILKEIIPPQCILVDGRSPGAVLDPKSGELKWITKAKSPVVRVGYMLQTKEDFNNKETVGFAGSITHRREKGNGETIKGRETTSASRYHWADTDKNGIIDDEEILAVYDDYKEIDGLTLGMEEIEDIWFGSGYKWDGVKKEFVVTY